MTRSQEEDKSELAEIADELLGHIAELKRHYAEFIRLLDDEAPEHEWEAAAPVVDSETNAAELVAIEMALAGRSRQEVEARIRDRYDMDDPAELLDRVFARLAR